MNKSDLLQSNIEEILINMDFIEKYQVLSDKFKESNEDYVFNDNDVFDLFNTLGFSVEKYEGNQFFTNFEECNDFLYRFGFTIKFNIVEFDLTIISEKFKIKSGGSYGLLVQLITDWKRTVSKPGFGNQTQLKELLGEGINLFNEIKKEVTEKFSGTV